MIEIISITGLSFLVGGILLLFTTNNDGYKWIKYFVYLGIVSTMLSSFWFGLALWVNALVLGMALYELTVLYSKTKKRNVYFTALVVFFLISSCTVYLSLRLNAQQWINYYCLIFTFDGYSQIGGQLIGKNKLAPDLSPGKTIEGLISGSLITLLTALFIFPITTINLVVVAIIMFFSLFGDLAASWYKRKMGVKDFNQIIPGHGGILDRFDSFLGATPILLLYYLYTSGYLQV